MDELNILRSAMRPNNCTQRCNQGRLCTCQPEPAEACTDIGAHDERAAAVFWRFYAALLIVVAFAAAVAVWA